MSEEMKDKSEINAELQKFKQHRDLVCGCTYEGLCCEYISILGRPYGIINGLFTIILFCMGFIPGLIWFLLAYTIKGNVSLCRCPNCDDIIIAEDKEHGRKSNVKEFGKSISTFTDKEQKRFRKEIDKL